jgi:hypothetical protein
VPAELALVREAGAQGDLRQGQVRPCLQEMLCSLDATQDDVLVRRQPGGGLELPREVVGVEADNRSELRQGRAGAEVPLDVLLHGAEPPPRQHPSRPRSSRQGAETWRIRWTARRLASDSAARLPPAPPAVSSASTAVIAARRWGSSKPSSGGTVSRAGSRPNASAATRPTNPGSRKMCNWSSGCNCIWLTTCVPELRKGVLTSP